MKIKTASSVDVQRCSCGCERTYVYLCDDKGDRFARFSLANHEWVSFGVAVAQVARDEDPDPVMKAKRQ